LTQHSFGESEYGLGIPTILRWTRQSRIDPGVGEWVIKCRGYVLLVVVINSVEERSEPHRGGAAGALQICWLLVDADLGLGPGDILLGSPVDNLGRLSSETLTLKKESSKGVVSLNVY
jgi:hypothetical protein